MSNSAHTTENPTGNSTLSRKWHPSSTTLPGDIYGPDTSATVSDAELTAIGRNMETHTFGTPPLGWKVLTSIPASRIPILNEMLVKCGMYNATQQRWNLGPDLEGRNLVDSFRRLLEQLFTLSGTKTIFIVSRDLDTVPDLDAFNKSSPLLAICGGSLVTGPDAIRAPGYNCCIVPVEIRRQKDFSLNRAFVIQIAIYARRCFMQQPARGTVYCFVLTEAALYICQFDRNGYYSNAAFDIHKNPKEFIHLVFTLSRTDNLTTLDGIFWDKGVQCMRLQNSNNLNAPIDFQVEGVTYVNPLLCGRVTTCWKVKRPSTNQRFLVKRTWDLKEVDDESEAKLLLSAKGLPYVAQMVHIQNTVLGHVPSCPRMHRVLVVEYYERTIAQFKSKIELLCILRDAVDGHRNLWTVGICHRDICPKNIRIKVCGNISNTPGIQGILVGLDRAKRVGKLTPTLPRSRDASANNTYMFQSMLVLHAAQKNQPVYPDYIDDLESFFYMLCYFCSAYKGRKDFNRMFDAWNSADPRVSQAAKLAFCEQLIPENFVSPYFGHIFTSMLESMRSHLYNFFMRRWENSQQHVQQRASPPHWTSLDGYRVFLAYINCAIAEMNVGLTPGRPVIIE